MLAISLRRRLASCAVLALLLLSAAYALQYLLGYQPCSLCLKQRVLWWAMLVCLAALSCVPSLRRTQPVVTAAALLASLLALAGGALAVFHAGGERGWWNLRLLCEGFAFDPDMTTEDLLALLQTRQVVSCDEPALRLFGFSLSEYNALLSLFVLGWLADGVRRELGKRELGKRELGKAGGGASQRGQDREHD